MKTTMEEPLPDPAKSRAKRLRRALLATLAVLSVCAALLVALLWHRPDFHGETVPKRLPDIVWNTTEGYPLVRGHFATRMTLVAVPPSGSCADAPSPECDTWAKRTQEHGTWLAQEFGTAQSPIPVRLIVVGGAAFAPLSDGTTWVSVASRDAGTSLLATDCIHGCLALITPDLEIIGPVDPLNAPQLQRLVSRAATNFQVLRYFRSKIGWNVGTGS